MKAVEHFRTCLDGEAGSHVVYRQDNALIGTPVVEVGKPQKIADEGDAGAVELDKAWYKYSRGNNPYADYQSFKAGFNLQK
jgi:hypothetical protein